MAAIGAIRKHGALLVGIIGIALLAFLVGDLSKLTTVLSDKNTVLKVDGSVLNDEYQLCYDQNSSLWSIFYEKQTLDESDNAQVHELTWGQVVDAKIVKTQLEKLGLAFSDEMEAEAIEEMRASLGTQTPNPLLSRLVQIMSQGASPEQAIDFIMNIDDYADMEGAREIYNAVKAIERMTIQDKERATYLALAQGSLQFSDELTKGIVARNNTALAAFATLNVNAPAFNELVPEITDAEMEQWFDNNEYQFAVNKDTRDIDVVLFNVAPSDADRKMVQDSVNNQYNRFVAATSIEAFNVNEMFGMVDSSYYKRADITIDTLQKALFDQPVGTAIAPINVQNQAWYFGKAYESTLRPDSILLAYLVVDYKTPQNELATRTQEEAGALADSLLGELVAQRANIFQLTPSYLGGRTAGQDTTMWLEDRAAFPALYDSLLSNKLYVQEMPGAFIVYQTLNITTPVEKRRFVLYPQQVVASQATIKEIRGKATQLFSESTSADVLVENANKNGLQVVKGVDLTNMMGGIANQLPNCREIIHWAFLETTEKDAISDVVTLNNGATFAVAAVRNIKSKEDFSFETVKEDVKAEMTRVKKLEMMNEKVAAELANNTDIKAVAQKFAASVSDSAQLSFIADQYQNRGIENEAIPLIFAATPGTTTATVGKNNIYLVNVYNTNEAAAPSATLEMEKNMVRNVVMGRERNESAILEGLKNEVEILDQRHLFYTR